MKDHYQRTAQEKIIERDPLENMRDALATLVSEERAHWISASLSDRVVELVELRERLDAELIRLVGEWDRKRTWRRTACWLDGPGWRTARPPLRTRRSGW